MAHAQTATDVPRLAPGLSGRATLPLRRVLLALTLFGVSFGYVEAAVVVYLRAVYDPLHARLYPHRPADDLLPLVPMDRLAAEGLTRVAWPGAELAREAATLVMLAAAALAVARNFRQWFAAFVFAFGLWDLFYYVFLKVLLDWPSSLLTWDILFLVPVPWVAPVLAPAAVALTMVVAGAVALCREAGGRPVYLGCGHWAALSAGGLIIVLTFCWDYRRVAAGGEAAPFPWALFAGGEALAVAGLVHALLAPTNSAHANAAEPEA
jgi:hypothetical protein